MKLQAFGLLLTTSIMAHAEAPTCPAPPNTTVTSKLAKLPKPVLEALHTKSADIVEAGQPFDATDVVMHGAHFTRFAFAWSRGSRWILITERGGIAYSNPVYSIQYKIGEPTATITQTNAASPRNVCEVATDSLNGKVDLSQ